MTTLTSPIIRIVRNPIKREWLVTEYRSGKRGLVKRGQWRRDVYALAVALKKELEK